jgi:hypothetical protein
VKKVRYAIGAAGLAPALGLMTPAAAGATSVAPHQPKAAKTVSLAQLRPDLACVGVQHTSRKSSFSGSINYSTGPKFCHVSGFYSHSRPANHISMRIRLYHHGTSAPFRTTYVPEHDYLTHALKFFSSHSASSVRVVWLALVEANAHSVIFVSPVRANIP